LRSLAEQCYLIWSIMSLENGTRRCVRIMLLVTLPESECTDQVAIFSVGQRVPSTELQTTRFTYVVPGLYQCYPQRRREQDISCTLEPHNIASVHPLGDAKPIKLSALRRGDKDMTKLRLTKTRAACCVEHAQNYDGNARRCHYYWLKTLAPTVPAATASTRGEFFRVG
jgi:hypothetical protein